jgi:thiol-disulfide isomerase/thioredoxin
MFKSVSTLTLALASLVFAQQPQQRPLPSAAQLKQDAESSPQSLDAQSTYIQYVTEEARRNPADQDALFKSLRENYEAWAKKAPDSAIMQWSLGVVCQMMHDDAATAHFDASVKIDPKFIPGYKGLTASAAAHNDIATRRRGLLKIVELNPNDLLASYDYIVTFLHEDRAKFFELSEQFIAKNPDAPPSAALLTAMADAQPDQQQRIAYWETILKTYVRRPKPLQGLTIPMRSLFEAYSLTDPAKALAFADEQVKIYPRLKPWTQVVEYQKSLMAAQALIDAKKYPEAQEKLSKLVAPFGLPQSAIEIAKANAQFGAGEPEAAYADLLKAAGRRPTPQMEAAIKELGAKMGKSPAQVNDDLWHSLTDKNNPMREFELSDTKGQTVKLASYRGKIVLVHFWHPSCLACHVELPYLKLLSEKFKGKPFVIVTINTFPEEEKQIGNWMTAYGFTTLLAPEKDWSKDQYNVSFNPTNFLLDGDGRIIFKTDLQTFETLEFAEHEVEMLLAHSAK